MDILLVGATGQMGNTVIDLCKNSINYNIVAGVGKKDNNTYNFPIYENIQNIKENFDIIIDFSYYKLLDNILDFNAKEKKPLVIATTGHTKNQINKINISSKKYPILYSGNMSLGINLLLGVVGEISKQFDESDIEIVEKHHNLKIDAPSGTAKMLFNSVNKSRNDTLIMNTNRFDNLSKRSNKEVGVHSIRGGNIVGEHTVIFASDDEVIEITHKASSKTIFAKGALKASEYIVNKSNGLFNMNDIIDI